LPNELIVRLFVYGTLAPGREAWPVLEAWAIGAPQADAVVGRLYDTNRGYPAATFGPGSERSAPLVHGTVVTLDPERVEAALAALDRYEGPEYERITVRTEAGIEAAAYAWIASLTGCRPVAGGRWGD
jgi:gamma-glutamylcyclotransferase (GGCT)/AIG2-like uncharacterized protein YtfP